MARSRASADSPVLHCVVTSDAGQCAFNFLFNGSDGERYMGTAVRWNGDFGASDIVASPLERDGLPA